MGHLMAFKDHPFHILKPERAHKEVVFPVLITVACQENHPAGGYRRSPVKNRLFQSLLLGKVGEHGSVIVDAIGDYRPAIVLTRKDEVEFVAPAGPVFRFPQFAGHRMEAVALWIPVAITPYRSHGPRTSGKWIIGRDCPVVVDTMDFTIVVARLLGKNKMLSPVANAEIEPVFPVECKLAAEMVSPVGGGRTPENHFLVDQAVAFQPGPHDGGVARPLGLVRLRVSVRDVNPPVLPVVRMKAEVEESALACRHDGRQPFDGRGNPAV